MLSIEETSERVFSLYRKRGGEEYIGEPVTQLQHAIQCALQAEHKGASKQVIMGAFLHDIGHLLDGVSMTTGDIVLGKQGHEQLGEAFLNDLGVPDIITTLVRRHVDAKRYLCHKNPDYMKNLSKASTLTLVHQGGPMSSEEAAEFESSPHFDAIIELRKWDEAAKIEGMELPPLNKYEDMFRRVMEDSRKPQNGN